MWLPSNGEPEICTVRGTRLPRFDVLLLLEWKRRAAPLIGQLFGVGGTRCSGIDISVSAATGGKMAAY
jgi:hypothetical protein